MPQPTRLQYVGGLYFVSALPGSRLVIRNDAEHTTALVAWMAQEGSPAHWNPFDTTLVVPGHSSDLPGNPDRVQVYDSEAVGGKAFFDTLIETANGEDYATLRWVLSSGNVTAEVVARTIAQSPWGTWRNDPAGAAAFVSNVVRPHFCQYASQIVH